MGARLLVCLTVAAACAVTPEARADELEPYPATGWRNGRQLKLQLVQIGWSEVEIKTARAFLAMRDAAAVDGVDLTIRSGWRTYEQQAWLYEAWRMGIGNKAAKPGYSNHQAGRALDIYLDESSFAWLEKHGRCFGFRRTVRKEPWHWEFRSMPKARGACRAVRQRVSAQLSGPASPRARPRAAAP